MADRKVQDAATLLAELREQVRGLDERVSELGGTFDLPGLERRAAALSEQAARPDLWNDPERAQAITRENARVQATLEALRALRQGVDEAHVFLELAEEGDQDALDELTAHAKTVSAKLDQLELQQLLGGAHDAGDAIVEIHPGAGGLEAQDWAEMLLRMYLRWCERRGFKAELAEVQPGEGAGIKSATFTVSGPYAYGYAKAESGVHRLVRISPFDANARRQTSFASVLVMPDIGEDIQVDIRDEDLRIDTYRSSGAGGQHVNKTDSAVRITHLPTGIVVACQNERSQHKNKARAMKILKARLYELERQKQEERMAAITKGKTDIGFGHQIRSYVLHPYRMVKDHRTNTEVGNADGVLDGDLDPFIDAYLRHQLAQASAQPSSPA
ncbi:MAG TPA: peptide chain release factor 2 [Candidatus Limnocylindria bacterium]|nr:peptide chain release factor 2 [Candidatus Limnocylindria bacterium]